MGRIIDSNPFGRDNKKGIRYTVRQRAPSQGVAERVVRVQLSAQFPAKAGDIVVLDSEAAADILGALKVYEVDVFVPTGDLKGEQVPSGDTRLPDMT